MFLVYKFGNNESIAGKNKKILEKLHVISSNPIHDLIVKYIDIFMRDKWDIGKTDIHSCA